jgi:hypothetical protein
MRIALKYSTVTRASEEYNNFYRLAHAIEELEAVHNAWCIEGRRFTILNEWIEKAG